MSLYNIITILHCAHTVQEVHVCAYVRSYVLYLSHHFLYALPVHSAEDGSAYSKMYQTLRDNKLLDKLHWDSKRKVC